MHAFTFQLGFHRIPTYGVFAVTALLAVVWFIRHYARLEGRDPAQTTDAIVVTPAMGFIGAHVLEIAINGRRIFGTPKALRLPSLLTGTYVGAVI